MYNIISFLTNYIEKGISYEKSTSPRLYRVSETSTRRRKLQCHDAYRRHLKAPPRLYPSLVLAGRSAEQLPPAALPPRAHGAGSHAASARQSRALEAADSQRHFTKDGSRWTGYPQEQ